MKTSNLVTCASFFVLSATALAGCNSGAPQAALPNAAAGESASNTRASHGHPYLRWLAPDARIAPRLLFLGDFLAGTVDIYLMPELRQIGQLAGFTHPYGECASNRTGNVWVTEEIGSNHGNIYEFRRDGVQLATIRDAYGQPISCAIDPKTQNLAVSNVRDFKSGPGNVVIYRPGGTARVIRNPDQRDYYWLSYNDGGKLWVDGYKPSSAVTVSECDLTGCKTVDLHGGTIHTPGFLQWTVGQRKWYLADENCDNFSGEFCIYPVSDDGELGTPIKLMRPGGMRICTMAQAAITPGKSVVLVGGDNGKRCVPAQTSSAGRWNFPDGGDATHMNSSSIDYPLGAAISTRAL